MIHEEQKHMLAVAAASKPELIPQIAMIAAVVDDLDTLEYISETYPNLFTELEREGLRKTISALKDDTDDHTKSN